MDGLADVGLCMALLSLVSWYDDDVESQLGELQPLRRDLNET